MQKIIYLLLFIIFAHTAYADFIEDLEDKIAIDNGFEQAVTSVNVGKTYTRTKKLQINTISYDGRIFHASCQSDKGENYVVGGFFDEAVLIPAPVKDLKAGHIMSEEDLRLIKVPVKRNLNNVVTESDSIIGKEVRRNLTSGKQIAINSLRLKTILTKGDEVKIVYRKNSLQIEARGQAMESGGQDEMIKVKNLDSNKILQVRVIDSQTVLLGSL